ncbi:hypothetical protein LEP1GSC061_2094 [Leptospira wolffii serovar Khorat str. Khorat-H2]|nr:hypothetical protein LEP1GSC061_2094 [Leptospira wolffii serovar Khorat str. Khorat-H2]
MVFERPAEVYGSILSNPERGARYFGASKFGCYWTFVQVVKLN